MAIWDTPAQEEEKTKKLAADSNKCPSCGSNLFFNDKTGKLTCKYCGNELYPEFFEISDLLSNIGDEEPDDSDKNVECEIICNSCGSTVVTDHNTAATFCAFCGSPALVTGRLTKAFKPDYIIPFKLSRGDAEAKFKEWASTKQFLPKDFTSDVTLKKITGLYVPFWLVDAECTVSIEGAGMKEDKEAFYYYDIKRKGTFKMSGVPFDGSKHIKDSLMESIEPFDYSEAVNFEPGYLQGHYAERYDLSVKDMAKRISDRFRDYMYEERGFYTRGDSYVKISYDMDKSSSKNYECCYAMMPVWFLSYEFEGIYYRIAINGQTGEIAGDAPVDRKNIERKRILTYAVGYAKLAAISVLLIASFSAIIWGILSGLKNYPSPVIDAIKIGCWIYGVIVAYIFVAAKEGEETWAGRLLGHFLKKVKDDANAIVKREYKMPPASTYIDNSKRTTFEKVDTPVSVTAKVAGNGSQRVIC